MTGYLIDTDGNSIRAGTTSEEEDDHVLASAYLLEHPEDGRENVDGPWLETHGFKRFTSPGYPVAYGIKCHGGGTLCWHEVADCRVKHAWTYRDQEGDSVALPPWKERDQARTLFRAVAAMIGGATATPQPELGSM